MHVITIENIVAKGEIALKKQLLEPNALDFTSFSSETRRHWSKKLCAARSYIIWKNNTR